MIRYLAYTNKINNIGGKRLPITTSNYGQNHQWLKQGWHNINNITKKKNIDTITNIITSKFKENMLN
jgi:hypothetical protein